MRISSKLQILFTSMGSFLLSTASLPCSWAGGIRPLCATYSQAETIFEGTVVRVGNVRNEPKQSLPVYDVIFSVEKAHKGIFTESISIQAISNMCFDQFEKDKRYLVYAHRSSENHLYSLRTRLLEIKDQNNPAKEDFDYLRNISEGKGTSSIHGFVYEWKNDPIKGVLITVEGNGKTYKTVTRKDGYFFIPEIQPGTYIIRCTVPAPTLVGIDRKEMKSKKLQNFNIAEIEVTVTKDGCSYTEFQLYTPENK